MQKTFIIIIFFYAITSFARFLTTEAFHFPSPKAGGCRVAHSQHTGTTVAAAATTTGAGSLLPSNNNHNNNNNRRQQQQRQEKEENEKQNNNNNSQKKKKKKEETSDVVVLFSSEARQLLGLKEAAHDLKKWKIRLQLTKPITWVPLSLIVMCGAAASGNYHWIWNPFNVQDRDVLLGLQDAWKGLLTVILAGPFSEGFAQTINDWYDRDIDAINEPGRPIPSGAITPKEVFQQLCFLFFGGLTIAYGLDQLAGHSDFPIVTAIALYGYFMSYIYSAPPLKLKQNGWTGDLAIGLCYISLPWWCGQSVFGSMDKPVDWLLPLTLSLTGIGAGIVNDFKSVEGDRAFGLQSIPILLGVDGAKYAAAFIPDCVFILVAAYLYSIHEATTATFILATLLPQLYFQTTLLFEDPLANDVKYMAMSQPFSFLGVLATAICIGQHQW